MKGYTTGSASAFYRNGLVGAMSSISKFGGATISPADIQAYATANPLNTSSTQASLKMINEQIWATTSIFANFVESWNNWKRSGYPELTPVNYVGNFSSGQIPRRQPFPASESSTNTESLQSAVARMGGDTWITKVWWDGGN